MTEREGASLQFEAEERLPWLEPSDDMPEQGSQIVKLVGLVLAGLLVIGSIVGGLWYWQQNAAGRGELIAAPEGPYKGPPEAEKARFDGDGTVAVAASEGIRPEGTVDPNRLPEQPIPPAVAAGRQPAPAAAPKAATPQPQAAARSVAAPAAAAPPAATGSTSGTVQLGAFASETAAARAWDSLKRRFEWLAPVNRSIVPATVNGRTVYRLQAAAGSSSAARNLCARFRVAGENCIVLP
jgi:hypothetical protein